MANNIGYFEIPADDIGRARKFYRSLFGWKIEPAKNIDPASAAALQYHSITTGPAQQDTMNTGGMYKRQMGETIKNFVFVEDFDTVFSNVEKLGGSIVMPATEIRGVGMVGIIRDTEGNGVGILKPEKK